MSMLSVYNIPKLVYNYIYYSLQLVYNMSIIDKILALAQKQCGITTKEVVTEFSVSRQYANRLIGELVKEKKLIKFGSTRKSFYIVPEAADKYARSLGIAYNCTLKNERLEEHLVVDAVKNKFPALNMLPENIRSIFDFSFSEMLNNAIEHSDSKKIKIEVSIDHDVLSFVIRDFGIGVFNSVAKKMELHSELEAIGEILKGKTTTMPKSHSGEGIFFTARSADYFVLDSYGYQLIFDNKIPDVFVQKIKRVKRGTKVIFKINTKSSQHLIDIFNAYTNLDEESDYGFDKTDIHVKLYKLSGVHFSRSQARRILANLNKFKVIVFDYKNVPVVGQAFADEIYRVFHSKYPKIKLESINMNAAVEFMVKRAQSVDDTP
jgi:hypothetical protein